MDKLTPNELAFIALANEYCHAMERVGEFESRDQFVAQMLKLLPRLYITVNDIEDDNYSEEFIDSALDEDVYDLVRDRVAQVMAEEDIYLEVFVEDMKYSDTPISASISENLADLYQEFFNLIHSVQDALTETQHEMLCQCRINAENYWGQTLCNVLRALNAAYYVQ
jgi:hypothetical protein